MASGAARTRAEVAKYASCTMLAASITAAAAEDPSPSCSQAATNSAIADCVRFLEENEFIRLQREGDVTSSSGGGTTGESYAATQLGLACLSSSLSPDEGLHVFAELSRARRCFVLENEMHIIYLVVPIYAAVSWPNLDWMGYLTLWESLSPDVRRVGELVGVEERFLVRAMRGTLSKKTEKQVPTSRISKRGVFPNARRSIHV